MINCSTTGLPPTSIAWSRGSVQLVNSQVYQLSQLLSDRATSTYSHLLTINQTLQELRGVYRCTVDSEQTATIQSSSGPNVTTGKVREFRIFSFYDNRSVQTFQTTNILRKVIKQIFPAINHKLGSLSYAE